MSYDRNIGNAATHLFWNEEDNYYCYYKICAYRRGTKDEERGGVAKNKKAEYKNDWRDSF